MKKRFLLTLLVITISIIVFGTISASAATLNVSTVSELQSEHNYANNMDTTWIYTHPTDADSLEITFSSDTETETRYDFIYIFDGNDNQIGTYDGTTLANQTITIPGNIVKIKLTSDNSVQKYGFRVTNIEAIIEKGPITDFSATVTRTGIDFTFTAPTDATTVTLEYSTDGAIWNTATTVEPLTSVTTKATVNTLESNVKYWFRLNVIGGKKEGVSNTVTKFFGSSSEDDFEFSNGTITKYIGADTHVIIPDSINGVAVTKIGNDSFANCTTMTNVLLPDSVTSIGKSAFEGCSSLLEITISESISSVGYSAFKNCSSLKTMYYNTNNCYFYNDSFNNIYGNRRYNNTPFEAAGSADGFHVIINDMVTNIPEAFLWKSYVSDVTIPESVTSINLNAFGECGALKNVYIKNTESWLNISFGNTLSNPMSYAEEIYVEEGKEIIFPEGTTAIKDYVLYNWKNISKLVIPDSITTIGTNAFYNSKVENLYIADIETWIDIKKCDVNFVANNLYIDGNVATEIEIPNTVTSIGDKMFANCNSITSVILPSSVRSIGQNAFSGCTNLRSIVIPEGITEIGYEVFKGCTNLTNINIPKSVKAIGYYAFSGCKSLSNVSLPENLTTIDIGAFSGCSNLTDMIIPQNVQGIDYYIFSGCSNLESVVLPLEVTSIRMGAFGSCTKLSTVYFNGSPEEWEEVYIDVNNTPLRDATIICFKYVDLFFDDGIKLSNKCNYNSVFESSCVPNKTGYSTKVYTDSELTEEFNFATLITNNTKLYIVYDINQYTHKFVDENNNVIKESTVNYGEIITAPIPPQKEATPKYTYAFVGWEGYTEGITQTNQEMVFTATYTATINQYTYKFVDENGVIIKEETVDYGTTIVLPEYSPMANTQQYTYTFLGWDGYTGGMQLTDDIIFNVKYEITTNQYTYKFLDEDGSVLKEESVDYGTTIIAPEISDKTEYYLFDYWENFTEGITLTDDITFTAVYRYNNYTITADGLSNTITVTYNDNYNIEVQNKNGYNFIGYFTQKDGKGQQITNEKGEGLKVYDIAGNLTVFPCFEATHLNKVEIQGTTSAMPGDTITQKTIFATDKSTTYFVATVKYPKYLTFKSIKGVDFKEATNEPEKIAGDYKYLDITCVFDYEGSFAEINKNYNPFEIEFDVATDATLGECEISIENVMLIGDDTFDITDIKNHTLTILPKLTESIEIIGKDEIDATEQFSAVVSPDYTTDKSVVWSVNDETVATITQDGTVTPVKNGTVVITATAKDGSEVFATKTVSVIAYAKISSLDFGSGVVLTEFNPDIRKYTVYVKENATSISLTPTFSGGGVLRPNGSGVWVSGRPKDFDLNDTATTITLNRENVTDMTNSVYTIEVIKFEGTKTKVSEDKKSFTITPINIATGKTVIIALYNGTALVEMQSAVYTGESIHFTTTKDYANAKVFVWENFETLVPICEAEIVK